MTKRHYLLVGIGILFLGLAIIQVVVSTALPVPPQTAMLPDGHSLSLERVDFGTRLEFGSRWSALATRWLPKGLLRKLGIKTGTTLHDGKPAVGIWLVYDGSVKKFGHRMEFLVGDDSGYFGGRSWRTMQRDYGSSNHTIIGIALESFPRRSRKIRLGAFLPDKSWNRELVAEFLIDNPIYGTSLPVWPAEVLPVSRVTNGLEITLNRLAFGVGSARVFKGDSREYDPRALATFTVTTNGVLTKDWKPDAVIMTDATGNERKQGSWGSNWREMTNYFQWAPTLWPDTGGMRFRFEFTRGTKAAFATNELLVLRSLVVPTNTAVTELQLVTNMFGHHVRVLGLAGKNGRFTNHHRSTSGELTLEVVVDPPMLDKQIDLIAGKDEKGRKVDVGGASWSRDSGRYSFRVEPHNQAEELDLTLAVHESVYVNFVVEPEMLKPVETGK